MPEFSGAQGVKKATLPSELPALELRALQGMAKTAPCRGHQRAANPCPFCHGCDRNAASMPGGPVKHFDPDQSPQAPPPGGLFLPFWEGGDRAPRGGGLLEITNPGAQQFQHPALALRDPARIRRWRAPGSAATTATTQGPDQPTLSCWCCSNRRPQGLGASNPERLLGQCPQPVADLLVGLDGPLPRRPGVASAR